MLNEKIPSLRAENYALWTLREAKLRVWSGEEFVRIWSGERFIARPSKENGWLMLKIPELSDGFQEEVL